MNVRTPIYRLKVNLDDVKPPIWRRLEVASDTKLPALHEILAAAMGWNGAHLHAFLTVDGAFGPVDADFPDQFADERKMTLDRILDDRAPAIAWVYDFGDVWFHRIELEAIVEADSEIDYPRCVGGRRACPPEDIGGAADFQTALNAWPPRLPCDPAAFDIGDVTARLRRFSRRIAPVAATSSSGALQEGDFDALEAFFERSGRPLAFFEGFLAAIASAPGLGLPSGWLPALLKISGRPDELSQVERILRWYNEINDALARDGLGPMIAALDGEADAQAAAIWVAGYRAAMRLDGAGWKPLVSGPDAHIFEPFAILSTNVNPEHAAAAAALPDAVFAVYEYWRLQRVADLQAMRARSIPERRPPKVGRNERCPCGSGRKYKVCCLQA